MVSPVPAELTVLSLDLTGVGGNLDTAADLVRAHRPDVALVQHAPASLRWRSKRAALARKSAMFVATAHRPGGLLVMTTLAVSVHTTSYRTFADAGLSAAEVIRSGTRWQVGSTDLPLDDALPDGIADALPLVVGSGARILTNSAATIATTDAVGGSGVLAQLLAHG